MAYPDEIVENLSKEFKLSEEHKKILVEILNIEGIQFLIENKLLKAEKLLSQSTDSTEFLSVDKVKQLILIYQSINETDDFKNKFISVSDFIIWINQEKSSYSYVINPEILNNLLKENPISLAGELKDFNNIITAKTKQFVDWIRNREMLVEISKIPHSKLKERRNRANELLSKISSSVAFLSQNKFLITDFASISEILLQYMNANIDIMKEVARDYFTHYFESQNKKIINIEFLSKKNGDQLGTIIKISYELPDGTEEKISYYIKTHQYGSNSRGSGLNPVDPKELFVYKVFEYLSIGPKVHFLLNQLSSGGFFIATQDVAFTKIINKSKFFKTFQDIEKKHTAIDDKNIKDILKLDIVVRIFRLFDALTNASNFGRVTINDSNSKWKIIDFRVTDSRDTYTYQDIFDGFKKGNGVYTYSEPLVNIINGKSENEKIEIAAKIIEELDSQSSINSTGSPKLTIIGSIEKAYSEVKRYIEENTGALGIKNLNETLKDFERYKTGILENYQTLSHQVIANLSAQVNEGNKPDLK